MDWTSDAEMLAALYAVPLRPDRPPPGARVERDETIEAAARITDVERLRNLINVLYTQNANLKADKSRLEREVELLRDKLSLQEAAAARLPHQRQRLPESSATTQTQATSTSKVTFDKASSSHSIDSASDGAVDEETIVPNTHAGRSI